MTRTEMLTLAETVKKSILKLEEELDLLNITLQGILANCRHCDDEGNSTVEDLNEFRPWCRTCNNYVGAR